ncbi:nucleotidyltransferase family protein [Asticcacaulis machinosus]|uniref:Nucleotidyltransferase family protein n=1 Tax=Asticcacaulis machinosus TaxID=2984211 RepID=A0ABT5HJM7_9CAUL|nr:nucleotidyltransferase family protein [Asticcacaulis machinosus]MDC7676455.1 nucleotidyltransferase family protein [Asticcacaulis machinosus]
MSLLCLNLAKMLEDGHVAAAPLADRKTFENTIACAKKNKLNVLLERTMTPSDHDAAQYKDFVNENRSVALTNSRILHLIHKTHLTLESAGINHVFYKGPLQQKILYGDFFSKKSVDADLLVARKDFSRAREVLVAAGFSVPAECHRLWWRIFLGEQHLFREGSAPHSVDLHHRLQQPGSPAPRHIDRFMSDSVKVNLGSLNIPTPNIKYIVLISAMNLVKAIYNRQPGGSYAMDLLTALRRMTPHEIKAVRDEAQSQGLNNTVRFSSRLSALVFGVADLFSTAPLTFPFDEDQMSALLLSPETATDHMPRRRVMLSYLSDHPISDFPRETLRWLASETARITPWF